MTDAARAERLSIEQMLEREYEFLHPDRAGQPQSREEAPSDDHCQSCKATLEQRLLERKASALCLSGGGIRSATFCLGALQALAAHGKLRSFTYLSTVSGGGYVGSWLSRWIEQSAGDLEAVEKQLAGGTLIGDRAEAPQVAGLRAYSNYLSPVWGLSADFFTLVAIVLRNLLLNWCVLLPLIGAFVLFPYLYLALGSLSLKELGSWPFLLLAGTGLGCGVLGLAYIASDLPARDDPEPVQPASAASRSCQCLLGRDPTQDYFPTRAFLPVLAFMLVSTVLLAWVELELAWQNLGYFTAAGVLLHLGSALLARRCKGCRAAGEQALEKTSVVLLRAVLLGVLTGMLAYMLCWLLKSRLHKTDALLYAALALPAMLFMLWLGTTGFVAVVRGRSSEAMREWWARSGGWWLAAGLFWLAWFVLILLLPKWLLGSTFVKNLLSHNELPIAVGGGLWGLLTGLLGYWSKHGATITSRARKFADRVGVGLLELAATVFIIIMLLALSIAWVAAVDTGYWQHSFLGWPQLLDNWSVKVQAASGWQVALAFGLLLLFAFVSSRLVGVNTFSLHGMYGNRLVRAYLGAARAGVKRHPHPFTGFDNDDNIGMDRIAEQQQAMAVKGTAPRLFHVLNLTLNLLAPSGQRLEWQQRKAASFSVTPLHAGSAELAYVSSRDYGAGRQGGISLGRAMTISGAAASPNMGYHSSAAVTFVMTLFNVRLGWWQPNPGRPDGPSAAKGEPGWRSLGLLVAEALGQSQAGSSHVYLSDGGHFENLGLYEMVRRRCKEIFVIDASADPGYQYEDLENAIRKIRVDFGVSIEFRPDSFAQPSHLAVATIHYGEKTGENGKLYYIKPVLTDDLPLDVRRYAEASRARDGKNPFPHQSTADQFFDEAQFESYRMLGLHLTRKALNQERAGQENGNTQESADSDSPDESDGKLASLTSSVSGLGKAALLASALTVGGVLGVSGTVALKDVSLEIKPGTTLEISRDSLDALRLSGQPSQDALALAAREIKRIADRLEVMPAASDPAVTRESVAALLAIEQRLSQLAQSVSEQGGAVSGSVASLAQSLARLERDMAALSEALAERKPGAALLERLGALEQTLRRVEAAVQEATPRRNIHGVEGSVR